MKKVSGCWRGDCVLLAMAAHPGSGGRQEIRLRAGAEEHEQPVLRPGARRLQEGREGTERRGRVPLHRSRRAWRRRGAGAGRERPDRATGRWHRGVAVERAGDGARAGRGAEGRHSGADLGFRSARPRQEAAHRLCRHAQLRDRREPREAGDGDQAEGRHDLHPVGRRRGGQPQRAHAGHPRHAVRRAEQGARRASG